MATIDILTMSVAKADVDPRRLADIIVALWTETEAPAATMIERAAELWWQGVPWPDIHRRVGARMSSARLRREVRRHIASLHPTLAPCDAHLADLQKRGRQE